MSKRQPTTKKCTLQVKWIFSGMEVLKYTLTFIQLELSSSKIQCAVAGRTWQRVNLASTWWELSSYNGLYISESSAAEFSSKYTNRHWIFPSRNWQWNQKENPWQKRPLSRKTNVWKYSHSSASFSVLRPKPEKGWEPWMNYFLGN